MYTLCYEFYSLCVWCSSEIFSYKSFKIAPDWTIWRIILYLSNTVSVCVRWGPHIHHNDHPVICFNLHHRQTCSILSGWAISNTWPLTHEDMMNRWAAHSCRFTHVVTLRYDARRTPIAVLFFFSNFLTSCTECLFKPSLVLSVLEHLQSGTLLPTPTPPSPRSLALHPNNRSNCILLSVGTNIDLFSGPTSARIRALLPPTAAISKRWLCPAELITVKSKDLSEESLVGNDPIIQWTCGVWVALSPTVGLFLPFNCFT